MSLELEPGGHLRGELTPAPDKSISHRALLLSALAEGPSRHTNVLDSADVQTTAECLEAMGAEISPVYAPVFSQWRFWTPSLTGWLSPNALRADSNEMLGGAIISFSWGCTSEIFSVERNWAVSPGPWNIFQFPAKRTGLLWGFIVYPSIILRFFTKTRSK